MNKILIIFLLLNNLLYSQSFLLTNNGTKYECKLKPKLFNFHLFDISKNVEKNILKIKSKRKKIEIKYEDIYGYYYYYPRDKFFYFKRAYIDNLLINKNTPENERYFFAEKIIDGGKKIFLTKDFSKRDLFGMNLDEIPETTTDPYIDSRQGFGIKFNPTEYYSYYFEKNEKLYGLISENKFIDFNSFFNDTNIVMQLEKHKHDIFKICEIVLDYNRNTHNENIIRNNTEKKGKIIIYRERTNQSIILPKTKSIAPLTISINNQDFNLLVDSILELELTTLETEIKVTDSSTETFTFTTPNIHYPLTYEIFYDDNFKLQIARRNQNSSYTKARLNRLKKKMKKH